MTSQRDEALVEMEARKDAAYLERNQVVAALAKCFPSGVARTAIEGWSEDWHGCVYIDLPTGQASWHFHDSQAYLFADLPAYTKPWDGHDTPEKYRRLAALAASPAAQVPGWKLVPVEPTPEMMSAGTLAAANAPTHVQERLTLFTYRAMLAASPPAPPQPAQPTAQQSHFCLECERLSRELAELKAQTAAQPNV